MSNPQENSHSTKQKITKEIWEAAMRDIQENQRFSRNPLTEKQLRAMRHTLNREWVQAQLLETSQRNEKVLDLLYERIHFLTHHLLIWEEQWERDQKWQKAIEEQLSMFMSGATKILRTVSEQAQEIIDGNPESQGDMMKLIMGTLNELRDKVDGLENSFRTSEALKKVQRS